MPSSLVKVPAEIAAPSRTNHSSKLSSSAIVGSPSETSTALPTDSDQWAVTSPPSERVTVSDCASGADSIWSRATTDAGRVELLADE